MIQGWFKRLPKGVLLPDVEPVPDCFVLKVPTKENPTPWRSDQRAPPFNAITSHAWAMRVQALNLQFDALPKLRDLLDKKRAFDGATAQLAQYDKEIPIKRQRRDELKQKLEAFKEQYNFKCGMNRMEKCLPLLDVTPGPIRHLIDAGLERLLTKTEYYDPGTIETVNLGTWGRVACLGLFLQGSSHDIPMLDVMNSSIRERRYVYRRLRMPIQLRDWRNASEDIRMFLDPDSEVTIEKLSANAVEVRLHAPLAKQLPMTTDLLKPDAILYGINVFTREPHFVPINDITHSITSGLSKTGKSTQMHLLLCSVLANIHAFDAVHIVDLAKRRTEFGRYERMCDKVHVHSTYQQMLDLIPALEAEMDRRFDDMDARNLQTWDGPQTLLIIDEYATVEDYPTVGKDEGALHKRLLRSMKNLSRLSRAAGIKLWIAIQKPTDDAMDSTFRANLLLTIMAYRLSSSAVSQSLFGVTENLPASPLTLKPGRFVFRDGASGQDLLLQAPFVSHAYDPTPLVGLFSP